VRAQVDVIVAVMAALEEQLGLIESELRGSARVSVCPTGSSGRVVTIAA
jgi:hypothetical protein